MIMIPDLGSDVKRLSEDFSNFFSWIPQLTQKPVVRPAHDRSKKCGSFTGGSHWLLGYHPSRRFSSPHPRRDSVDQTPRHLARIIPTLVGHCYPPFLGGGAQTHHLPTFRAIASCSGGHRIPSGSTPFRWFNSITGWGFCQPLPKNFLSNSFACFRLSGSISQQIAQQVASIS